jgi:hypothetical protein
MPGKVTVGTNTDIDSLATLVAKWHYFPAGTFRPFDFCKKIDPDGFRQRANQKEGLNLEYLILKLIKEAKEIISYHWPPLS